MVGKIFSGRSIKQKTLRYITNVNPCVYSSKDILMSQKKLELKEDQIGMSVLNPLILGYG